jgi:ATP-dependent Lhr-like helicase
MPGVTSQGADRVHAWFASAGRTPFEFQRAAWRAYLDARSGLIHAPTGIGKTLAAFLGPVIEQLDEIAAPHSTEPSAPATRHQDTPPVAPLTVLWITPLRALASDTVESLLEPVRALDLPWTVEKRTGDTSSSAKARQRARPPTVLVTTPESLTILLSYADGPHVLRSLRCVVVDEWHELLSTKRGVQTELALARLRTIAPQARTWGLSATLANIDAAAAALVGPNAPAPAIIHAPEPKRIEIETLIPDQIDRYPWSGHLGTKLADAVIDRIQTGTTLLFTNTRSQAELWFREILRRRPDLIGQVAIHHGSLDRDIRDRIESLLRSGHDCPLRCVVCTSSLDLGVDFSPVDQVIQVGSPKGVARLIQRAGRSGHRPGLASRIIGVPTNAMELVEFAAARDAVGDGALEDRVPLPKPLDVLAQHIVTVSMPEAFDEAELLREVRSTLAYHDLTDEEWGWAIDFASRGGPALTSYPDFARITRADDRWRVATRRIATRHRMGIGTIVADESVKVQFANGRSLGSIEESFISRLHPGDRFVFAGRVLQLVRLRNMTATVQRSRRAGGAVPRWNGGRFSLSTQLARAVLARLDAAGDAIFDTPEMQAVRPLFELQASISRIPRPGDLLAESIRTRQGHHAFLFPFAGRLAHEGLGAVLSLRLSRIRPRTITAVVNDYGIHLMCDEPLDIDDRTWRAILTSEDLLDDLLEAVNAAQFARRQFRTIARIAGLTHQGYPGRATPSRQLQASAEMFFDVFRQFDPGNLLLTQATREVLDAQLEIDRLRAAIDATLDKRLILIEPDTITPLAFPLFAESLRATTVTSETWEDRVRKMSIKLDEQATERHGTIH